MRMKEMCVSSAEENEVSEAEDQVVSSNPTKNS